MGQTGGQKKLGGVGVKKQSIGLLLMNPRWRAAVQWHSETTQVQCKTAHLPESDCYRVENRTETMKVQFKFMLY